MAGGGPYAGDLVGGDGHAHARAAEENAAIGRSISHPATDIGGDIGIVHRFFAERAAIDDLVSESLEQAGEPLPGHDATVVAADRNPHGSQPLLQGGASGPEGSTDGGTSVSSRPSRCSRI